MVGWIIGGIALGVFVAVIVWALRWRDPSWTDDQRQGSFFWSKRGSGER